MAREGGSVSGALETRVLPADDPASLNEAAAVLRAGGLVAFPTETVYGLGADASNAAAVRRIFEAKGRPATNPLIVHADDIASARVAVSSWPRAAAILAERFWPGPLTLVLPRSPIIPDEVTAGLATVGVRIPDCPAARSLLRTFGRPVAAPSANRSTGVSPTEARHVLSDLNGRVELILDGGPTRVGIESTVFDLTSSPPRVLRPGAITAGQLEAVLGEPVEVSHLQQGKDDRPATSPGQMEVHYAPRALVVLVQPEQIVPGAARPFPGKVALITAGRLVGPTGDLYDDRVDWAVPEVAARELYATLHRWDEEGVHRIEVVLPPDDDAWRAVRDRLWRASRRWAREGQGA